MSLALAFGYLLAFVLGSVAGSFLNVVVYRLPSVAVAGIRPGATYKIAYLAWPMSFCPHCGAGIKPWHNIPILSWVLLRGRAKCCGKGIKAQYLALEFLGGVVAVACLYRFGWSMVTLLAAVFCLTLLVISWIDAERYVLPDVLVLPLLWLGLLVNWQVAFVPLEQAVGGAIAGWLFLAAISEGTVWTMRKRMLGAGDPKLFAAIGAWLGWPALPAVLLIAAVSASVYGIGLQLARGGFSAKVLVPFGPHLSLGGVVILFWGYLLVPYYLPL